MLIIQLIDVWLNFCFYLSTIANVEARIFFRDYREFNGYVMETGS
jgi:hypothetical protein